MKHFYFILLLLPLLAKGQISALQGKAGETAVLIKGKGIFLNTGDASIGGSFSYGVSGGGKTNYYGVNFKAKATGGTTTIFKGNDFKPEINVSAFLNRTFRDKDPDHVSFGYLLVNYAHGKYSIFQDTLSTVFNTRLFEGLSATLGYYQYGSLAKAKWLTLWAVSASYGYFNNSADLDPVDRYVVSSANSNGQLTNVLYSKTSGLSSDYKVGNAGKINADGYVFPPWSKAQNVGIGGFFRDTFGDTFSKSSVGVGLLVNKPKDVNTVSFGMFYQFQNVFNETNRGVDQSFNLTAGYTF